MQQILTPCFPRKACAICSARMYPKSASPAKRAAKFAHQAEWYGRLAKAKLFLGDINGAVDEARRAFGFALLALDTMPSTQAAA